MAVFAFLGALARWLDSWVWAQRSAFGLALGSIGLGYFIQTLSRGHAVSAVSTGFLVLLLPWLISLAPTGRRREAPLQRTRAAPLARPLTQA